jgi:hypothetical protein
MARFGHFALDLDTQLGKPGAEQADDTGQGQWASGLGS